MGAKSEPFLWARGERPILASRMLFRRSRWECPRDRESSYLSANTACPTAIPLMLMSTRYVPTPSEDAARL